MGSGVSGLSSCSAKLAFTGLVSGDLWVPMYLSLVLLASGTLPSILSRNKNPVLPTQCENKPYFLLWQNPNLYGRGRGGPEAGLWASARTRAWLSVAMRGHPFGPEQAGASGAVGAVPHLTAPGESDPLPPGLRSPLYRWIWRLVCRGSCL